MLPLKNWTAARRGYVFGQKTAYNAFHIGLDVIVPEGTEIIAWGNVDVLVAMYGKQGGNQMWVKAEGCPKLFRFMHLCKPAVPGKYKSGSVIGFTGNTGSLSTGAHLHVDISSDGKLDLNNLNNFEDPELYFKNLNEKPMESNILFLKDVNSSVVYMCLPINSPIMLDGLAQGAGRIAKRTADGDIDTGSLIDGAIQITIDKK